MIASQTHSLLVPFRHMNVSVLIFLNLIQFCALSLPSFVPSHCYMQLTCKIAYKIIFHLLFICTYTHVLWNMANVVFKIHAPCVCH